MDNKIKVRKESIKMIKKIKLKRNTYKKSQVIVSKNSKNILKRGDSVMSPVSKTLQSQLSKVNFQQRQDSIVMSNSGHLVLTTTNAGKSMREQYLEEQGYDID